MSKWASGKEQKATYREGKGKGFKQAEDEIQLSGGSGAGQIGRLDNEEAAMVHDVTHSATQEDGSEPSSESDI